MSRGPRIRTLKPENWQDERIGRLGREARLLRDVLITYADDDGRWRHLPSAVIGHGYPYDDDVTNAKISRWTGQLVEHGVAILYVVDGQEYGCFPRWHLHQTINRYTPSSLPACDDTRVIGRDEAALIRKGDLMSSSVSSHDILSEGAHPHAQARGSRSGSLPVVEEPETTVAHAIATIDDKTLTAVAEILRTCKRFQFDPELMAVANVIAAHPDVDHAKAAHIAVSRGVDPTYRTTDAGRALDYACADLEKRAGPATAKTERDERRRRDSEALKTVMEGRAA